MSQGNARWGVGATGTPGPTGPPGPAGPPGAGASGAKLFELAPIASPRFIGRYTPGSGVMQEMDTPTAVGMLPVFSLVAKGLVPAPITAAGLFLRDDATWAAAGAAGRPSGVTLGEQADAPPLTVQGQFGSSTGAQQALSPGSVASLIGGGWGSGMQLLKAPTGGVQGRLLRDDGIWVQPSFVASGIGLPQLGALSPLRVVGRFTAGSGTPEQLSGDQIASMIGKFAGTGLGLVPTPTGGALGRMLRDDGAWVTPSFVASGVTLSQIGDLSPLRILGRSTLGSGSPEQLTQGQVASMLPVFSATGTPGLVPQPSAAGSGMFLRDDGKWASPTGLGNGQFALMPPSTIKGTAGATGIPQDLVGSGVATLLPLFNNVDKGLVPGSAGGTSAFLRAGGVWAAPSVAAGVSGVSFSQLQDISAPRFIGRLAGSGSIQEITPLSAASMLPRMLGSGFGLVVAPTGGAAGAFLKDDGTWATPAGGSASGVANNQLLPMPPFTIKGRNTLGSGIPEDLTTPTVASMLPRYLGSGLGLVAAPTLPVSGNYLKDDGTWSSVGTGISNAQHAPFPPLTLQGRFTLGSGTAESVTAPQVASMLPLFSASGARGVVAGPTGGVLNNFLRDDGSWQPVGNIGTGFTNAQFGFMPPLATKARFTAGTGAPEDVSPGQMASLLPPFFASGLRGIVVSPTGGTTGKYLQDDGSWTTPSAGGATGVANGQMIMMPPFTLKGRSTLGSGVPEDLTRGQVASLLPLFSASGGSAGLVTPPTGGASGYFLRDDGTFVNIIPRVEKLLGPIGSGATVGSATVDFTTDPYQNVSLVGNTQFKLVPPTLHRHTQLRMSVGASGRSPTFYGTMVKWAGGSGSVPAWNTGSGSVNIANFFYDGTIMWGQAGVGFG